jgi:uncharacterized protein
VHQLALDAHVELRQPRSRSQPRSRRPRPMLFSVSAEKTRSARRMSTASILWRRLETPGHDACRLERAEAAWSIEGTAVFRENDDAACLAYRVLCDDAWHTQRGEVQGWVGPHRVEFRIERTRAGVWTVNDTAVRGLEPYVDLDLAFTPATNLPQLRRVALAEGRAADVPVAWLDVATGVLSVLPQRYERRSNDTYWYEAPSVDYRGLLQVGPNGFITSYPRLWEAES